MRLWVLGSVCFVIFLLVQLPMRFVLTLLPPLPMVTIEQLEGTPWKGNACVSSAMLGTQAICGTWQLNLSELLSGQANWSISATMDKHFQTQSAQVSLTSNDWKLQGKLLPQQTDSLPANLQWLPKETPDASTRIIEFSGRW